MAEHARFSVAAGVPVYFCDPAGPWQRGEGNLIPSLGDGGQAFDRQGPAVKHHHQHDPTGPAQFVLISQEPFVERERAEQLGSVGRDEYLVFELYAVLSAHFTHVAFQAERHVLLEVLVGRV